jgi:glyoxylase-like metal-dependent hydrolase (beta-lactamase superfamily II)/predicted DCC family thiol-disulfide oxidoreductase YuxK
MSRVQHYDVFYDGQCEICQACVSWLQILDRRGQTSAIAISPEVLAERGGALDLDDCLRELHVVASSGEIYKGWDAVARLARLFPATWIIGALGNVPPFKQLGRAIYRFVARNRHALSKCRGGACKVVRESAVRDRAAPTVFWTCHTTGLAVRLPLILGSAIKQSLGRISVFRSTYGKRVELLSGKLNILFLNGVGPNLVPLLFGELFTAVIYDGVIIDPGSTKMRASLARHFKSVPQGAIESIVATHAHEEHIGNLNWLAEKTSAPIYVSARTADFLRPPAKLPWIRSVVIGQPPSLEEPFHVLGERLATDRGELMVISTPGHCDDHISLYDPKEKLLLAGDAFMGTYFATPNPDVISRVWLATLERLAALDIEILVEGHGHIHTMREDIPDIPGVVIREHPSTAITEKLEYMRWLRERIDEGIAEGLSVRAVEASCFPWTRKAAWENFANDELIRMLSMGHFSRTELIRSFVRKPLDTIPTIFEARLHGDDRGRPSS